MPEKDNCDEISHRLEDAARDIASTEINRRQIEQERGQYVQREYYDREHDGLRDMMNIRIDTLRDSNDARIKALESTKSNLEGRLWGIGIVIVAVVTLVQIGLHFFGK